MPKTVGELMALPVIGFGMKTYTYTYADKANGYVTIDGGRQVPINMTAMSLQVPFEPEGFVRMLSFEAVSISHTDDMGVTWGLALHDSGKWYRRQR
jgi:hypothetical protein